MAKGPNQRGVHGDDLLYRFFNDLFLEDSELAEQLPVRMIASMGIWLPLEIYYEWPVMLPWVVRDATCRGNLKRQIPDQWGAPDEYGFLRDDNSLIKGLTRSLSVRTPIRGGLHGARMGTEFVASHIWRVIDHAGLASRHPLLNSFVPNLVWLPSQVSKLSDRESGPVQLALQSISWQIYRHAPVAAHLLEVVKEAWTLVPEPKQSVDHMPDLNWFEPTDRFRSTRRARLDTVLEALQRLDRGQSLEQKVITTRYGDGLPHVSESARSELLRHLHRFQSSSDLPVVPPEPGTES